MEHGQQYSQPGVTGPMVGQSGQYGPGQFPGQQMNPTPQQMSQYMQPAPGGYNPAQMAQPGQPGMVANQQHAQKQPSTVVEVIRSNYTTIALFEVSGGYDPAQQYPTALCFVMGVPGVKDPSKQSGRRYEQSQKIVMKFSTQEIRSLGQSLINIATFKQAAAPFEKHSDPSKNSYSQNNGQQNTKKLKATFLFYKPESSLKPQGLKCLLTKYQLVFYPLALLMPRCLQRSHIDLLSLHITHRSVGIE